jgi:arsenate reductase
MSRLRLIRWVAPALVLAPLARSFGGEDVGPLVRSLWLVQRYGTADSVSPRNDQKVKGRLFKALGKDGALTAEGVQGLIEDSAYAALAGPDGKLDTKEMRMALDLDLPESRRRLLPQVAAHIDELTTSFDLIDETHREAGDALVAWIGRNHAPGKPLHITLICTGNSRRSILGATMGNIAAAYYGLPEIRFHSGGTAPSAFNPRSVESLRAIGVEIEATGREATRGEPSTANPIYRVRWGRPGQADEPAMETNEFSKLYSDEANPREGFAALLVCGEADASCPYVKGASARISMPYLDPKIYDSSPYEAAKYAERRDDIGRLMVSVLMRVRNQAVRPRRNTN